MCTPKSFATSKRSSEVPEILSTSSKHRLGLLELRARFESFDQLLRLTRLVFMLST